MPSCSPSSRTSALYRSAMGSMTGWGRSLSAGPGVESSCPMFAQAGQGVFKNPYLSCNNSSKNMCTCFILKIIVQLVRAALHELHYMIHRQKKLKKLTLPTTPRRILRSSVAFAGWETKKGNKSIKNKQIIINNQKKVRFGGPAPA